MRPRDCIPASSSPSDSRNGRCQQRAAPSNFYFLAVAQACGILAPDQGSPDPSTGSAETPPLEHQEAQQLPKRERPARCQTVLETQGNGCCEPSGASYRHASGCLQPFRCLSSLWSLKGEGEFCGFWVGLKNLSWGDTWSSVPLVIPELGVERGACPTHRVAWPHRKDPGSRFPTSL